MAVENYTNTFNVYLASPTTNGTSLAVSQAAPIDSGFRILIDYELMLVTSGGTTTTWNVTRNIEGSTLASHATGASIVIVLSAGSLDALRTQWNGIGTYANLPVTGMKKGDTYTAYDSPYNFQYDGSLWQCYGIGARRNYVPPVAGWTWTNQGPATLSTTNNYPVIQVTGNNGRNLRYYQRSYPTPPYTLTANLSVLSAAPISGSGDNCGGLAISDGTKLQSIAIHFYSGYAGYSSITYANWTNVTTNSSATALQGGSALVNPSNFWLRILDDNSSIYLYYSQDGYTFQLATSYGRTSYMTPSQIGLFVDNYNTTLTTTLSCYSWQVTTP